MPCMRMLGGRTGVGCTNASMLMDGSVDVGCNGSASMLMGGCIGVRCASLDRQKLQAGLIERRVYFVHHGSLIVPLKVDVKATTMVL